jgi:hypothetical protein
MASADDTSTTDLATREDGAVVLSDTAQQFIERFPGLDTNADIVEIMQANLGDLEGDDGLGMGDLERLTVPPGGGTSWIVPDLEEGEKILKELEAVLLHWDKSRAMWISNEISNEMPDCWSRDGVSPDPAGLFGTNGERADELPLVEVKNAPGQFARLCQHCPMNAFGSSTKPGAKGKQCKEARLLYILQPDEVLPQIISVPPTSLKKLRAFLITLAAKQKLKFTDALLGFKLAVVEGGPGGKYSTIVPMFKRRLEPEERELVRQASANLSKMLADAPPPIVSEMHRAGGDDDLT